MKNRSFYSLFLLAFSLCFVCLLISGASRLIASTPEETEYSVYLPRAACLGSMPEGSSQVGMETSYRSRQDRRVASDRILSNLNADVHMPQRADANGNILGEISYMRSVYHVFALGDGFV